LPALEEQELITLKNFTVAFSIGAIVFLPLFYLPFPILALIFACDTHHKKVERIQLQELFCTETRNFWTIMYVILGITYVFVFAGLILSLQNGSFFNIVILALASLIYLMQAYYFRKFYEAYEKAFGIMAANVMNNPHQL